MITMINRTRPTKALAAGSRSCCSLSAPRRPLPTGKCPTASTGATVSAKSRTDSCGSTPRPAQCRCAASAPSAGPARRRPTIARCSKTRSRGCAPRMPALKKEMLAHGLALPGTAAAAPESPAHARQRHHHPSAGQFRNRPHGGLCGAAVAPFRRGDCARAKAGAEQQELRRIATTRSAVIFRSCPRGRAPPFAPQLDSRLRGNERKLIRRSNEGPICASRSDGYSHDAHRDRRDRELERRHPRRRLCRHHAPKRRAFSSASAPATARCLLFIRHTSASLVIQENADPDVQVDLVTALDRLAPADAGWVHDTEGPGRHAGACQIHAQRRFAAHSGHRRDDGARHLAGHLCRRASRPAAPARGGAAVLGPAVKREGATFPGRSAPRSGALQTRDRRIRQAWNDPDHDARCTPHRVRETPPHALHFAEMTARWTLPLHYRRYHAVDSYRAAPLNDAPAHHLLIADDHPLFRGALREAVHGLFSQRRGGRGRQLRGGQRLFSNAAAATSIWCCSISPCRACAAFPA